MTDIPPRESDYRPLRIIGDQLRIGDIVWTLRNRRKAGGVLRAECRHDASGDAWGEMTVTFQGGDSHGLHGTMTIDRAPWLVRGWCKGLNGTCAEAGPVSDEEFEDFSERLGATARSG